MIVTTSCPLRISLVGGSTDNPLFLDRYEMGSVISFPCNLKCYTTIHKDIFGANSLNKKFVLNYSRREEVDSIENIQNELIKFCFKHLNVNHINLFLTSDVYSSGSGLASSSSYIMSLVKSISVYNGMEISDFEICKISMEIEKNFNPLVGQQDFYGSLGGLKQINFFNSRDPEFEYLDQSIFDKMDMFLLYTGITRKSTNILKSLDVDKCFDLLHDVEELKISIKNQDLDKFNDTINKAWSKKKSTSTDICSNPNLMYIDDLLSKDPNVLSHKLLGAGGGGYFLIFSKKDSDQRLLNSYEKIYKISISQNGIISSKI